MKLFLKLPLYLFVLITFENKLFAITDYKIKRICKNEKRMSKCVKNLQEKRSNLEKGNQIEIPVIPYKE